MLPQRPYIPHPQSQGQPMSPTAGPSYTGPRYSQYPPPQGVQGGWQSPRSGQPMSLYNQPPAGPHQMPAVNGHPQQQYHHQRQPSGQHQPPYHAQSPVPTMHPNPPTAHPQQALPPVQQPRQPMQDLLSSPERITSNLPRESDAPPPLPPSKPPPPSLLHLHSILLPHLQASLPPLQHSLDANRQQLRERHEDLISGEPAIRDEMARLEAVKKVCDSVGRKLGDAVAQGQERVAELESRGEVSVDEVVCGISIVHNQYVSITDIGTRLTDFQTD